MGSAREEGRAVAWVLEHRVVDACPIHLRPFTAYVPRGLNEQQEVARREPIRMGFGWGLDVAVKSAPRHVAHSLDGVFQRGWVVLPGGKCFFSHLVARVERTRINDGAHGCHRAACACADAL